MAQLMPLPLTVSCFSKIQIVFYLSGIYRLTWVVPEKGPLNGCDDDALNKKGGGIRPIAVGVTVCRLASKCAISALLFEVLLDNASDGLLYVLCQKILHAS